jgi:hypothetical protein
MRSGVATLSPGMLCLSFEGGSQRIQEMCSEPGEPEDPRQCAEVKRVAGERRQSAGSRWKSGSTLGVRWLTDEATLKNCSTLVR